MAALLVPLLLNPCSAHADQDAFWSWTTRAAGFIAGGKLAEAVNALAQARAARAAPELDAMVGLAALAGAQPDLALKQLRAAIARGSTEPLVFYWAGRAALATGKRKEALRDINRAIAVGGDRPAFRVAQAMLLRAAGKPGPARKALARVCAATPNLLDPSLYPTAAEGAVDLLAPMLRRFPHRYQLARTRAHLLWRAGRSFRAHGEFAALARKGQTDDGELLAMLARAQHRLGLKERALVTSNKAAARAPDSGKVRATRGELLLAAGQPARGVADLKVAADRLPRDGQILLAAAQACQEAEDAACARRFFKYALVRDASLAAAHFGLALLRQQGGKNEAAARGFERALALDPGNPRYYRAAAQLAALQKQGRRAAKLLASARRAGKLEKKLLAAAKRGQKSRRAMLSWLSRLAAGTAGKKVPAAIGGAARACAAAHLAHQAEGAPPIHPARMGAVLRALRWERLLRTDPTVLELKGRTTSGKTYVLKKRYVLVPFDALR